MSYELADLLLDEGEVTPHDHQIATADLSFNGADGQAGQWIDADTIKFSDGSSGRLKGYDAKEVAKTSLGVEGEVGGLEQKVKVAELARAKGFDRLVDTGEVDPFGRKLFDLQNAAGSSFGDEITAAGVVEQSQWTTATAQEAAPWEQLYQSTQAGETSDSAIASEWIKEAILEQGGDFGGFKQLAFDEQEAAGLGGRYVYDDAVQIRNRDRGYNNKARNPLSTSWDIGVDGAWEGLWGTTELIGNRFGWDELEDYGEGKKEGAQFELRSQPQVILDYKEVKDTGDFIQYVGNLGASSLPYMAVTMGAALTAPITGGLSLSAPAAIYAGQVWNEMGDTDETEKSASLAIGAGISMAVLDRLGIKGLANTTLLSAAGRKQLIDMGIPEEQIVRATAIEAAKLSGDAAKFAKDRLAKQEVLRNTLGNLLKSGTRESITEVAQETTAYLAAVAGSDKEYDPDELLNRITNAAIGGGVLGGGFSIPGSAISTGKWADVAYRLAPAEESLRTQENTWAEEEMRKHGHIRSNDEIALESEAAAGRKGKFEDANTRAKRAETAKKKRTFTELRDDLWEGIPGLWRGSVRHILGGDIQEQSVAARKLASLFGGSLYRTFSGANYEAFKNLKVGEYKNLLDTPQSMVESFGFNTQHKDNLTEMSEIIYGAFDKAEKKGDAVNWDSLVGTEYEQHIPALKQFDKNAKRMTNKLWEDQKKYNPELGKLDNFAFRHRTIDKIAVERNPTAFTQDLMKNFDLDLKTAEDLTATILNVDTATDVDSAFAVLEGGGYKPSAHKKRSLGLSDDAVFADAWLEKDILKNLSEMAKSGTRYQAHQKYVGNNNKILDSLLDDMEQELKEAGRTDEEAKAEVDRVALGMKNYLDADSGNYKRPKTKFGQSLVNAQKNFMFLTTLSALPLATISSMVELALTAGGLKWGQVEKLFQNSKSEFKAMGQNIIYDKDKKTGEITPGRSALLDLNYFDWETGAATRTGATEITHAKQRFTDIFFRSIGLKQFTDLTRSLRASIAGDFFADKLEIIRLGDSRKPTNEYVEAIDALRNHGFDVERFIQTTAIPEEQWTADDRSFVRETLRNATYEFINNAVVLPGTANRPLFYNDPRFALFTQFHGFISAFQGHVLPKLYRQAFKGQTPSMKYNAFAVMMTMIMLGFLSQYIKDLLKYGRSTPYLDENIEYIQRGVGSTGLLGVGERALNFVHPIYETRTDSWGEWAFDTVSGEAAAISKGRQFGDAVLDIASGETEKGVANALKFAPYIGPATAARKGVAEWAFGDEE